MTSQKPTSGSDRLKTSCYNTYGCVLTHMQTTCRSTDVSDPHLNKPRHLPRLHIPHQIMSSTGCIPHIFGCFFIIVIWNFCLRVHAGHTMRKAMEFNHVTQGSIPLQTTVQTFTGWEKKSEKKRERNWMTPYVLILHTAHAPYCTDTLTVFYFYLNM